MKSFYCVLGILYFIYIITIQGQSEDETEFQLDLNQSYCFRFTWLGQTYDNTSTAINSTCAEWYSETRAEGVPCRTPFVITYDGTPPDMQYLWEHHKADVLCRRARGQVCAKYSFTYNNELWNTTYMCTRAFVVGEGAASGGCYDQMVEGFKVQVCLCESNSNGYAPCFINT